MTSDQVEYVLKCLQERLEEEMAVFEGVEIDGTGKDVLVETLREVGRDFMREVERVSDGYGFG